jgi:putative ABC transport system permease protein
MALPRKLWAKAPLALLQHRAVLLAVVCTSFLVALAAASAPLLRAGAESEALEGKLRQLTPLAAGLTIDRTSGSVDASPVRADRARRAAGTRLSTSLPFVQPAILTSASFAIVGNPVEGRPFEVFAMTRTNALAHVGVLSGGGPGAYVPSSLAKTAHLAPGDSLQLLGGVFPGVPRRTSVRVGGVYRQLDGDLSNPYWVNFVFKIRPRNPDAPLPPPFVLMRPGEFYAATRALGARGYLNTYELPVQPGALTPGHAKQIAREFGDVRRRLAHRTPLARRLGCLGGGCKVTSSLQAAVLLAKESTDALTPVISLLAAFAGLIALGAAFVAGAFGVRRRAAEGRLSVVGGESRGAFGTRAALEAALPALAGAAAGFVCASELVRVFTPSGTVDHGVFRSALVSAAIAAAAGVLAFAAGAWAARGPSIVRGARRFRLGQLPWELPVLVAAAIVFAVIERGGGLVENESVGAHPRLVVLCFPLLLAAGVTGLAVRAVRPLLRGRRPTGDVVYLAVRRLAAARTLLVLLMVTAAVSFCALTFAEVLGQSLHASSVEKAYVANGSDVQALIDPAQAPPRSFPFPIAKVEEAFGIGHLDDGSPVEVLALDPNTLADVVRSPAARALAASDAPVPVIADHAAAHSKALLIDGRRLPVDVVASVRSFPGMVAGEPLLVLSQAKLLRAAPQALDNANAYLWARGPRAQVQRAVEHISPSPSFVTTIDYFLQNADLSTADRTYGFLRVIALGAAAVALVALLLYLHARARAQLVTSAFLSRMGMRSSRQALSTALEAAALVALAALAGAASALLAARPLVTRVDPIPEYAPAATVTVPWLLVGASFAVIVLLATLAGAAASAAAARGDVGEALRVA